MGGRGKNPNSQEFERCLKTKLLALNIDNFLNFYRIYIVLWPFDGALNTLSKFFWIQLDPEEWVGVAKIQSHMSLKRRLKDDLLELIIDNLLHFQRI